MKLLLKIKGVCYLIPRNRIVERTQAQSVVRTVMMDQSFAVEIYPNPVTGHHFTINAIGVPTGLYSIQLYSAQGKLVASFNRMLDGNLVNIQLDKPLTKGLYRLKLSGHSYKFSTNLLLDGN